MRRLVDVLAFLMMVAAVTLVCPAKVKAIEADMTTPVALPAADIATPVLPAVDPVTAAAADAVTTGMTYVDVSIDNQILTYYVNGAPVLITPCVTGKPGRGTPRGVFAINSCIPGKYLNGPTWHVWVNRWMRFCGNVGIHDATWRKSFGGDIYKSNGSHGCVNIPHDQAVLLYSMVGVGTPVIVH